MYIDPNTFSNQSTYAPGLIQLTAEQEHTYLQYNGFVKIISTDPVEIEPATEKWEAWKAKEAAKPQPEQLPTLEERTSAIEAVLLAMMTKEASA